jgi:hypothetical protein
MQYAIINFTSKQTQFYATFDEAAEACAVYNTQGESVYIVDVEENAIEKL